MSQPQDPYNNPFAPPQAEVADASEQVAAGSLAGRGARLGAVILDSLAVGALAFGGAKLFGMDVFSQASESVNNTLMLFALGVVASLLLQGWLLHTRSQTIGKVVLGLRIVKVDGSRAHLGRTFGLRVCVMTALTMIPVAGQIIGLIDALMIFGKSRRCLHDLIAGTVVVKA
ncbi:MAG: transporter [Burkholderiales bacterium PBB6]|nr:MAG: transporter [Burkholderiales bacterium PBB6]